MAQIQMGQGVKNRYNAGDYVISSAKSNADSVGTEIEKRWGLIGALAAGAIKQATLWLAGILERSGKNLRQKELDYVAELADDVEPRRQRDERGQTAWTLISGARDRIEQMLGDEGLKRYGLWEPVTQNPGEVAHRLTTTVELLEKAPVKLEDPFGSVFDTVAMANKLKEALGSLNESLAKVLTEERERQDAINVRDQAITEWFQVYQGVATTLRGLFLLAGRADLADRLRPTVRRASGLEDTATGGEVTSDAETTEPAEPSTDA